MSSSGIIVIVILIVFGIFIFLSWFFMTRMMSQQDKISSLASVTAKATAVTKRMEVEGKSTYYFITFEFEAGERKEFWIQPEEYGLIVEGDAGQVTYQGKMFKKFERLI